MPALPLDGDGQIVARVIAMQYTDPWAKAGVMFREGLGTGSEYATIVVTAGGASRLPMALRLKTTPARNTDGPTVNFPFWLKLVRAGDTFSGYVSPDGLTWHRVDDIPVPMAKKIYVGLAVSAHNKTLLNSALFDHVQVSP